MEQKKQSFTSRLQHKDHAFYGHSLDGQQLPSSLVIRDRAGNQRAFSYQYLSREMTYNPSEGIRIRFIDPIGQSDILIEGRHLLTLWDMLVWHRVSFIREAEKVPDSTPEDQLCVTAIFVREG